VKQSFKVMEKEKIMKSQSQIKHANQEKMIMMGLEHPNIVRLWYAFQTPSKMFVAPPALSIGANLPVCPLIVECIKRNWRNGCVTGRRYMVLDLCTGGDVFGYMQRQHCFR
jgi:serine/threonine protein kinase